MSKILGMILTAGLAATAAAQQTASTPATPTPQPAGSPAPSAPAPPLPAGPEWQRLTALFDGKTLDGWEFNPARWSVQDGAMRGTGAWCLAFTRGDYGSFRLLVTSRVVTPEANNGSAHLGLLFWGSRPAAGDDTPKATGMLNLQPPYGSIWDYGTNKNVPVEHVIPKDDNRLRWHDWHTSEVLANIDTGVIRMAVDGVEITRYKHPDPSTLKKGPIAMQVHSRDSIVEYKDVNIEVNPQVDRLYSVP